MEGTSNQNNKRIAKNTIFLYIRMVFLMAISLFTSRVLLNALGVVDFGIQNVVGGFVSMFQLVSGTMATTISRFFTYEMGLGNKQKLNVIFSTSINIQIAFIVLIFILAESFGIWFLNYKMIIPPERLIAANWVFQLCLISFCINIISVPYNAIIIAHERMLTFAYISILDAILKLLIVYAVIISPWDRLIVYSFLLCMVAILIRLIYGIYCKKHFEECTYHYVWNKPLLIKMFGFAGWNYLGTGASILRTQGLNVLMNLFFGTTVNTAKGLVTQVESAVTQFVGNFTMALNPQITKSYAHGDKEYMYTLVCMGAKYSYFLMLVIALPLAFEAHYVLELWLGNVPEFTDIFLQLTLLYVTIDVLSSTLVTSIQATGDIKKYQLFVGLITITIFPISYVLFKIGLPPYSCFIVSAIIMAVKLCIQLPIINEKAGLPVMFYVKRVIIRVVPVSLLIVIVPFLLYFYMHEGLLRFIVIILLSIIWGLVLVYAIGMEKNEKAFVNNKLNALKQKIIK